MLTLLFAYGAYRNSRAARQALRPEPLPTEQGLVLVAFGAALFFLWPLILPAALLRYVPDANPLIAFATPLPLLLSLIVLELPFYFVYSLLFLIIGLHFVVTAFTALEEESSQDA